jgi:hypothetical protein
MPKLIPARKEARMEPLSTQLAELLQTMPQLTRLPPNNSSPLLTRWPALAAFPETTLAQIRCHDCKGEGVTGYSPTDTRPACRPCRGTGLVCPTCHGARWLRDGRTPPTQRELIACPACATPEACNAAILAVLQAARPEAR